MAKLWARWTGLEGTPGQRVGSAEAGARRWPGGLAGAGGPLWLAWPLSRVLAAITAFPLITKGPLQTLEHLSVTAAQRPNGTVCSESIAQVFPLWEGVSFTKD